MTTRRSSLTLEYLSYPIELLTNNAEVDPTATLVQMAFVAPRILPVESNWIFAQWDTPSPGDYYVQVLLGPGGTVALAAGTYIVWLRITDTPERVVQAVDTLVIAL